MPRPRQFDEERVLVAARTAFWNGGYAATSMEDLLAATGLGKGSLYGAFGDKRSLFLRVLREYDEANDRTLRTWLAEAERGIDVVRAFLLAAAGDPGGTAVRRGCLLANTAMELAGSEPEVAAEARRSYEATTTVLADAVRRAQREGDVDGLVDPERAARAVLAGNLGLIVLERTGQDLAALRAAAETLIASLLPTP